MKLLIDLNLSLSSVDLFDYTGFQAAHWSALSTYNASGSEIMACAKTNEDIVLTHGLDFSTILAATQSEKPSVAQTRAVDVNPDVMGKQVIAALQQMSTELVDGALLTVDTSRIRVRLLSLRIKPLSDILTTITPIHS